MSKRANVLALAIIIVVVSASAAQGLAGKNTIFSNDIAEGEVRSSDIKNGTIQNKDIKKGAITADRLAAGVLTGSGPAGPTGATGPQGPQGPSGFTGLEYVQADSAMVPDGAFAYAAAACPIGKTAISGGVRMTYSSPAGSGEDKTATINMNTPAGDAWKGAAIAGTGGVQHQLHVEAICVNK